MSCFMEKMCQQIGLHEASCLCGASPSHLWRGKKCPIGSWPTNSVLDRFHSYLPTGYWARGTLYCSRSFSCIFKFPYLTSYSVWLLTPLSIVTKDFHVAQSNGFVQAFVNWQQCSCWPTWPLTVPWNMLPGTSTIQYQFSFYLFGCPTSSYFKV